jgi:hypothetical protein
MCFMFDMADLGLYYEVVGDHWDDVGMMLVHWRERDWS